MSLPMVNTFFEEILDKLLNLLRRVTKLLSAADVPYRVVGGMAVYFHVSAAADGAGRLTRDIDIAIRRTDLSRIAAIAPDFGFQYRHAAGVDMLLDTRNPQARRAVHLVFSAEKVRPEYSEPVPDVQTPAVELEGTCLMPVQELVRMKLTSFRDKDRVHVRDMDEVGLITPEVVASLSPELQTRLQYVRDTE